MKKHTSPMRVGLFGLGAIGREVATRLDSGVPGLQLSAATARDQNKASAFLNALSHPVPAVDLPELVQNSDIVMESAPAAVFESVARATLQAGKWFVPLSVGGLLKYPDLPELAEQNGARIIVPTGALIGLDAVRAAAEGQIKSVRVVTRKPPGGLAGAPHLVNNKIDVSNLSEALMVFEGSARDGVAGFPANVNVAAALSLAGIGPDQTQLQIWADPQVTRNTHRIEVEADSARFSMTIENVPTEANPATGAITALSALNCLRGLVATVRVGS